MKALGFFCKSNRAFLSIINLYMEQRMFNAARSGDIQTVHQLIQENPFILSDHVLNNSHDNPLTIAIKSDQVAFAVEIFKLDSQLALVLNQDGTRPLDVASAYGNVEVVKEIITSGPDSCRLRGSDGRTAIHYAAMNGRVEIICELLSACSDCAKDVTVFGETALHLAAKYFRFEALECMLQWLEKLNMVELVNSEDLEGNTILHYAALRKQLESVQLLLEWNKATGNMLNVNAANKKGHTPIDIVDILIESSTYVHLREILLNSGGVSSPSQLRVISDRTDLNRIRTGRNDGSSAEKPKKWRDILKHFEFQWDRDSPGEARGTLLVILALIATVTFQAGINPPSYLTDNSSGSFYSTMYLTANTVAFMTTMTVIDYLTSGFPFQRELRVSMFAVGVSYGSAVFNTNPAGTIKDNLLFAAIITPYLLRILPSLLTRVLQCIN